MQISELRSAVNENLLAFAWNEWAQLGVLADVQRLSRWAADPEAFLLFSLQLARAEPRLFDEVLDWAVANSASVSVQRLRNQYASDEDTRLAEAALAWAAVNGARLRPRSLKPLPSPEPLFYEMRSPGRPDPVFAQYGLLKPLTRRTMKSRFPDLALPINFAFRLRRIFGLGTRADVLRFLLTASAASPPPSRALFTTLAIAEAAGYSKRNVQEALNDLSAAEAIGHVIRGNEHLYSVDPEQWRLLLPRGIDRYPLYRDWPHALVAVRELHRWLSDAKTAELSGYMRSSEARRMMDSILPSLHYAGMPVTTPPTGETDDYWPVFVDLVQRIVATLSSESPW